MELERNAHAARSGSGTNNRLSELTSAALAEYPEVAGWLSKAGFNQGEFAAGYFCSELSPADMLRLSIGLTKAVAARAPASAASEGDGLPKHHGLQEEGKDDNGDGEDDGDWVDWEDGDWVDCLPEADGDDLAASPRSSGASPPSPRPGDTFFS